MYSQMRIHKCVHKVVYKLGEKSEKIFNDKNR